MGGDGSGASSLGSTVVVCFRDAFSIGEKLLVALSNPSWHRSKSVAFLPLEKYGIEGVQVAVEMISFTEKDGAPKISVLIIAQENLATPCVAHSVLDFIMCNAPVKSSSFMLIIASAAALPTSLKGSSSTVGVAVLNDESGVKKAMFSECAEFPSTLKIKEELISCFLHFIHVTHLPTIVLLVPFNVVSPLDDKAIQNEMARVYEGFCHLVTVLAKQLGFSCEGHLLQKNFDQFSLTNSTFRNADWNKFYI